LFIWLNADEVILFLFGVEWSESAWILKIIILSCFGLIIESYTRSYLKAAGESSIILRLELFKRFFGISALFVCMPFGLKFLLWVIVFLSIFNAVINAFFMCKYLDIKFDKFISNISTPLILIVAQISYAAYSADFTISIVMYVFYSIFSIVFSLLIYKEARGLHDKK
jgi:O-antigen/teichoic acid export membrane protein